MASKTSIISLFVVLLATFCYSAPTEELSSPKPDHQVDTNPTTVVQENKVNMHLLSDEEASILPDIPKIRSNEEPKNEKLTSQGQYLHVSRPSHTSEEGSDDEFTTPKNVSRPLHNSPTIEFSPSNSHTLDTTQVKRMIVPLELRNNRTEFERRVILPELAQTSTPPDSSHESVLEESDMKEPTSDRDRHEQTPTSENEFPKRSLVEDTTSTPEILSTTHSPVITPHLMTSENELPKQSPVEDTTSIPEILSTTHSSVTTPYLMTSENELPKRSPVEDTTSTPETLSTTHSSVTTPHLMTSENELPKRSPVEDTTSTPEILSTTHSSITTPHLMTSENEFPKRSSVEDTTSVPEILSTTQSSVITSHLTYSEIVVPGDVRITTVNGTRPSEHILNQLSRGEKYPIIYDP